MPRLIRRQPLLERIQGYLNPADLLLWLSEEFESQGWDQLEKEWAVPIGFILNLTFLVARANSRGASGSYDDVFGDSRRETGWFSWLVSTSYQDLGEIRGSNAHILQPGLVLGPLPHPFITRQRLLHVLAQETLPIVRSPCRYCS